MSEQPAPAPHPPRTGHETVDAALDLAPATDDVDPAEELQRLGAAHEALHRALTLGTDDNGGR